MSEPIDLQILKRLTPFEPTIIKVCIYAVKDYSLTKKHLGDFCLQQFEEEKKKQLEKFEHDWKIKKDEALNDSDLSRFH